MSVGAVVNRHQLFMSAPLDNPTILHKQDLIGCSNGGKAVGNNYHQVGINTDILGIGEIAQVESSDWFLSDSPD